MDLANTAVVKGMLVAMDTKNKEGGGGELQQGWRTRGRHSKQTASALGARLIIDDGGDGINFHPGRLCQLSRTGIYG